MMEDYSADSRKRAIGEVDGDGATQKKFARGTQPLLKLLIPSSICGHVIGKGGSYIAELKNTYGGHIMISAVKHYYPATNERILLIKGTTEEINNLNYQIMERVTTGREPLPDGRGEKTKILVTPLGAGMIIGKAGSTIKQICEQSGAKIVIANVIEGQYNSERILTMTGTLAQRAEGSRLIIERIAEEPGNMANTRLTYGMENMMNGMMGGGDMPHFPQVGGGRSQHDPELVGLIEDVAAKMEKQHHMAGGPPPPPAARMNGIRPRMHTLPTAVDVKMDVPRNIVGFIMGKKGQGIRDMVRRSNGARFEFENTDQPPSENNSEGTRKLTVTGNFEQVHIAYNLVHDKVEEFVSIHGMNF